MARGTEGCSRLSFCPSPTLAPEATSLRNLSLYAALSAGGCCMDVQRGFPELRTLDRALQGRRTARRNLALLVRRLHVLSYSQVPPRRILSREFVVSSVKAFVDRRVLSSPLLPLAYARSGSNLSLHPPFWQLVCWRLLHGRAREGPELRTLDQALQGRRTTGRNFWLFFYCVSTSSPPHESLGNRSQGKSCPNR